MNIYVHSRLRFACVYKRHGDGRVKAKDLAKLASKAKAKELTSKAKVNYLFYMKMDISASGGFALNDTVSPKGAVYGVSLLFP